MFNQPFARSLSILKQKPVKAQKDLTNLPKPKNVSPEKPKVHPTIITRLAENESMSSRLLSVFPNISRLPAESIAEDPTRGKDFRTPRYFFKKPTGAVWDTIKKPIFPSVMSNMLVNNPMGSKRNSHEDIVTTDSMDILIKENIVMKRIEDCPFAEKKVMAMAAIELAEKEKKYEKMPSVVKVKKKRRCKTKNLRTSLGAFDLTSAWLGKGK